MQEPWSEEPMKIRYITYLFLTVSGITACCIIFLAFQLKFSLLKITKVQERRFQSIELSHQLLQSSNTLTSLARIFAQTGEEKFKEYFFWVLDIRSGVRERPVNYRRAFWDFVLAGETDLLEKSSQIKASIEEQMRKLEFSSEEFDYLKQSKDISDQLAQIENRAFNFIQGLYQDESGEYKQKGEPNIPLARQLLYSPEYFEAKAAIMKPIEKFYQHVNERTQGELLAVHQEARVYLLWTLVATVFLLGLLVLFTWVIYNRVLQRIDRLVDLSFQITQGDLQKRSDLTGSDELGVLGRSFNEMVSQLSKALNQATATQSRIESELSVAKDIQMSMVPLTFPPYPGHKEFDIYAKLIPAREVGGDFYDFYFVDKNELCFVMGDVSGKGVPAALMMAVCRTLLKARAQDDASPASIITHINDEIAKENPNCMFITVFIGRLNISTGELTYTNAGHTPTLRRKASGKVEILSDIHGPVVGIQGDFAYEESHIQLEEGESLLLYTDGVTEAHNLKDEMYSEEKLIEFMKTHPLSSSESFMEDLYEDVKKFEQGDRTI